jgi:hypothetical protein
MESTKRRGRPATGRTTKTVRVPDDMNMDVAVQLYYDVLPVLRVYQFISEESGDMVRYERLRQLFFDLPDFEAMRSSDSH